MKAVKAVQPYFYKGQINFKHKAYEAWKELGGLCATPFYPPRILHHFAFCHEFPRLYTSKKEARLRFVQSYSLRFDTFPDYTTHEIIPFFWDCWPEYYHTVFEWLRTHNIQTAVFTSSQFANMVKERFPDMNILAITEGIDVHTYKMGKPLDERSIDFLEYGRDINKVVQYDTHKIKYVRGKVNGKCVFSEKQLIDTLANSKIVAAYPKSWTAPEASGGIETLTQRYWECMLSRCIMIGHAPGELINLLGYNPVIEIDRDNANNQLSFILANIRSYQSLVDKNRYAAIKYGDWKYSIKRVMNFLKSSGYCI